MIMPMNPSGSKRKMPLRQYIVHLYFKCFGKERPDAVLSIEEKIRRDQEKKAQKREAKLRRRQNEMAGASEPRVRRQ
jgi:hypothetical protein